MDTQDKQPRVLKPSTGQIRKKRLARYGLRLLGVVVIVVLLVIVVLSVSRFTGNRLKDSRSAKLTATVKSFEDGKHMCTDGLKQINTKNYDLSDTGKYTTDAREAALDYLTSCTFITGNSKQALVYASQLDKLYAQDGQKSAQKRAQLASYVNYIKSYNQ